MVSMNCILKHVIEGKIEGSIRRGRRRKQLLIDLTKKGRYLNFIEEALDRPFLRNHFGGDCGPSQERLRVNVVINV